MAKKETHIPAIIDTPEALEAKIAAMKEAQKLFATYTQEQVDKIFKAAATAADKARIPLAKAAVEETGIHFLPLHFFNNCFDVFCVAHTQSSQCHSIIYSFSSYTAFNCF